MQAPEHHRDYTLSMQSIPAPLILVALSIYCYLYAYGYRRETILILRIHNVANLGWWKSSTALKGAQLLKQLHRP